MTHRLCQQPVVFFGRVKGQQSVNIQEGQDFGDCQDSFIPPKIPIIFLIVSTESFAAACFMTVFVSPFVPLFISK